MMPFYRKHDWEPGASQEDIEQGYTDDALHGLFLRCAVCGKIKATELFSSFISDEYVICPSCSESKG